MFENRTICTVIYFQYCWCIFNYFIGTVLEIGEAKNGEQLKKIINSKPSVFLGSTLSLEEGIVLAYYQFRIQCYKIINRLTQIKKSPLCNKTNVTN